MYINGIDQTALQVEEYHPTVENCSNCTSAVTLSNDI